MQALLEKQRKYVEKYFGLDDPANPRGEVSAFLSDLIKCPFSAFIKNHRRSQRVRDLCHRMMRKKMAQIEEKYNSCKRLRVSSKPKFGK